MFRTSRRRNPVTGATYPWLVPSTAVVNQYYFYYADEEFGPVCVKFSSYFPYTGRLYLLTELRGASSQFRGQVPVRVATVPAHGRIRGTVTESGSAGGASARFAGGDRGAVRAFPAA